MDNTFAVHESTRKRRRWGCTCGCLIFVVGLLFGGIGLGIYLFRGVRPVPMDRYLEPGTTGFVVLRVSTEDAGIADMLRYGATLAKQQQGTKPASAAEPAIPARLAEAVGLARTFGVLIHPDVYFYLARDPAAARENFIGVVQLRYVGSWFLARIFLNTLSGRTPQRDGSMELFTTPAEGDSKPGGYFALTQQAVVFGNREDAVVRAAKTEKPAASNERGTEAFQRYLDDLNLRAPEEGEDVAALVVADSDRFASLVKSAGQFLGSGAAEQLERALKAKSMTLADIQALRLSANVESADRVKVTVAGYCNTGAEADKLSQALKAVLVRPQGAEETQGVAQKTEVRQQGSSALATVDLTGLKGWIKTVLLPGAAAAPAASR
jgi:hypothetical protein